LRFGNSKTTLITSQKKRFFFLKKNKVQLSKGFSGFFFWNSISFECVYLKLLRRKIKKNLKKKKKKYLSRKVWLNLKPNYPISKKSKNSRMGKGKGSFLRWVVLIKPMHCFIEFSGFNFYLLNFLKKNLRNCYRKDLDLFFIKKQSCCWSKPKICKFENFKYRRPNF